MGGDWCVCRTVRGSLIRTHPAGPGLQPPALPSLQRKEFKEGIQVVVPGVCGALSEVVHSQKAGRPRGQSESALIPALAMRRGLPSPLPLLPLSLLRVLGPSLQMTSARLVASKTSQTPTAPRVRLQPGLPPGHLRLHAFRTASPQPAPPAACPASARGSPILPRVGVCFFNSFKN